MSRLAIYGIVAAVCMAFISGIIFTIYNTGYDNGYETAHREAKEQTQKAISELSKDAENAHIAHDLCVESGGMWSYTDNECRHR